MALISNLSIAPMIDWSYSHFRVFMRLLAPESLIYTEMLTTGAVTHNPQRSLYYHSVEQPLALQLGGSDPSALALCAKKAEQAGYHEVNLNLGCPSDKVQAGRFGACLMSEAALVNDCIKAMKDVVSIPVTAKTRIGIDHQDSYAFFADFVDGLVEAGADKLVVHARKAWLHGLNPKQNRTIPPVHYDYVYRIKSQYPTIPVVINGNINSISEVEMHLKEVDGVMIGRLACQNPYAIAMIGHALRQHSSLPSRSALIAAYFKHVQEAFEQGERLSLLLKPIFNMAFGLPDANQWKSILMSMQRDNQIELIPNALDCLQSLESVVEC